MTNNLKVRIESPDTIEKFSKIFASKNGVSLAAAEQMYQVEKFNFMSQLADIKECTVLSTMKVFLEVVSNGLSFNSTNKHVYLMTRSFRKGEGWENRLVYQVTADGRISQAVKAGSLKRVSKPVIVYEGDDFRREIINGIDQIKHIPQQNRPEGARIEGVYTFLTFPSGDREAVFMDTNDIDRLKGYSSKQNKGKANALYTSNNGQIDVGFLQTKAIKHALKNIRRTGTYGSSEIDEEGVMLDEPRVWEEAPAGDLEEELKIDIEI